MLLPDPEWGMLMALIQKYWGILLAPNRLSKVFFANANIMIY